MCLLFAFGLLLGWAWSRLFPRPMIDRVSGFAVWACVAVALAFVLTFAPGEEVTIDDNVVGSVAWAGIFTALVLVEQKRVNARRQ